MEEGARLSALSIDQIAGGSMARLWEQIHSGLLNWVAVKELKLSHHIGETLLFTIYTHYGNLI